MDKVSNFKVQKEVCEKQELNTIHKINRKILNLKKQINDHLNDIESIKNTILELDKSKYTLCPKHNFIKDNGDYHKSTFICTICDYSY